MPLVLTESEVRVLGCLVEKEITTPDYYPLTLNAVRTACNQKSNRDPVVDFDDKTVVRALDGLRDKKLAWMVNSAGSRVPKYQHNIPETLPLSPPQLATLCVLMLRGPQTAGEIKARSERLHPFATVAEVETALDQMACREEDPLTVKLPLQPGRREPRYTHLLAGQPDLDEATPPPAPIEAARKEVQAEEGRFRAIEETVAELKTELEQLRETFQAFKKQFE